MDINALFAELTKEAQASESTQTQEDATAVSQSAATGGEEGADSGMDKLAEDLCAGGRMFADAFCDRAIEKLAMAVPAAGSGILDTSSKMEGIAAKIGKAKGATAGKPGDSTSVRAENHHGAMSGAKGAVNPAKALG
jgi:hypothetical protein